METSWRFARNRELDGELCFLESFQERALYAVKGWASCGIVPL